MGQNRKLTELKNIGTKIAARLNEIGIRSESDLRRTGPVKAHKWLRDKYPNETIPVCYYLYSFEGALTGKHWNDIGEKRKKELRQQVKH